MLFYVKSMAKKHKRQVNDPVGRLTMNSLKGELEYGLISLDDKEDYRLYRYSDVGMGETEYRIFRNGNFFAMFDNRKDAETAMTVMMHQSERDTVLDEIDCILTGYESYKHISGNIIFPVDPTVTISILKKDLEKIRNRKSINMVDFVKWAGLEVLYFAYCEELAELRQSKQDGE